MSTVWEYDKQFQNWNKKQPNSDQVDFRTPDYLFDYIKSLYNRIDYDAACENGKNNLAEALRLEDKWPNQKIIYSNPPFDTKSIIKWIEKGYEWTREDLTNIHIILIPNKLCTKKLTEHLKKIDGFIFLGGRVNFKSEFSCRGGSSRNGSVILIQDQFRFKRVTYVQFKTLAELRSKYDSKMSEM